MDHIMCPDITSSEAIKNLTNLPDCAINWLKSNNLKLAVEELIYKKVIRLHFSYSNFSCSIDISKNNLCINSDRYEKVLEKKSDLVQILWEMPRNEFVKCTKKEIQISNNLIENENLSDDQYNYIINTGVLHSHLIYWRIVYSCYQIVLKKDAINKICNILHTNFY